MNIRLGRLSGIFAGLAVALVCAPASWAGCVDYGVVPHRTGLYAQPYTATLMPAAFLLRTSGTPSIVGFWHFVQKQGTNVFDAGYEQWHSDGTEIYNSGSRAPDTGNFCMGVWQEVGPRHYKLNHRAIGWMPGGTTPAYVATIIEDIYLSTSGNSFSGTYKVAAYDTTGHLLQVISSGKVTADRVTVTDTTPGALF